MCDVCITFSPELWKVLLGILAFIGTLGSVWTAYQEWRHTKNHGTSKISGNVYTNLQRLGVITESQVINLQAIKKK